MARTGSLSRATMSRLSSPKVQIIAMPLPFPDRRARALNRVRARQTAA
jgi:hypothetical protein